MKNEAKPFCSPAEGVTVLALGRNIRVAKYTLCDVVSVARSRLLCCLFNLIILLYCFDLCLQFTKLLLLCCSTQNRAYTFH